MPTTGTKNAAPAWATNFLATVRSAVVGLAHDAESYGFVRRDIRAKATPRFPFGIDYRILGDQVEIIAIMHGHRNPRRWRRRT